MHSAKEIGQAFGGIIDRSIEKQDYLTLVRASSFVQSYLEDIKNESSERYILRKLESMLKESKTQ